jgi:hypothetical protein
MRTNKKYTYKEVKNYIESLGYELISKEYLNRHTKLIIEDKNGYCFTITLRDLKSGRIPCLAIKNNPYSIQNIKLWLKLNNKEFELISEDYLDSKQKLKLKCLKKDCGEIFEMSWGYIQIGQNCPFCHGLQVGLSNCLATKNPELAKEWHLTKNGGLTPYDVTANSGKKAWWICEQGHEWKAEIKCRNQGVGCSQCNKSKGEKEISNYLINNSFVKLFKEEYDILKSTINTKYYMPQKEFDGLLGLGNGNLSYDFFLPNYNLLIEYQGQQHEKYIPGFHKSKKDFLKQQEHDRRKREYAHKHNINLLEIWYWDFDNIEEILTKYIITV